MAQTQQNLQMQQAGKCEKPRAKAKTSVRQAYLHTSPQGLQKWGPSWASRVGIPQLWRHNGTTT